MSVLCTNTYIFNRYIEWFDLVFVGLLVPFFSLSNPDRLVGLQYTRSVSLTEVVNIVVTWVSALHGRIPRYTPTRSPVTSSRKTTPCVLPGKQRIRNGTDLTQSGLFLYGKILNSQISSMENIKRGSTGIHVSKEVPDRFHVLR